MNRTPHTPPAPHRTRALAAALALALVPAGAARAQTIEALGTIADTSFCYPHNLGPRNGWIAGCNSGPAGDWNALGGNVHLGPAVWSAGFSAFPSPLYPPADNVAWDVNSEAVTVGVYDFHGAFRAFVWDARTSEAEPLPSPYSDSAAYGINEEGIVVGAAGGSAALWKPISPPSLTYVFGPLHLPAGTTAYDVNDSQHIVGGGLPSPRGLHAFRLDPGGRVLDLQPPWFPNGSGSAWAVNNHNEAVGLVHDDAGDQKGVFWRDKVAINLDDVCRAALRDCAGSVPHRINDRSHVVGRWIRWTGRAFESRAFFYDASSGLFIDLNTALPPKSGWFLESATGIDEEDTIVGVGTRGRIDPRTLMPIHEGWVLRR